MRKRKWIIAMLLGWMVIGLSFSINDYVFRDTLKSYYDNLPSLPSLLLWDLVYWPVWAALTPLIFFIARRFPLGRNRWHPNLLINLLAALLLPVLQRAVYLLIAWPIQAVMGETISFLDVLLYNLPLGLVVGGIILLVSHLKADLTNDELQMSRLKAELSQAQLQALTMQLQPHFLFNTLNSISALLHKDVKAADRMLAQLGDFLRLTRKNADEQTVLLKEELEFLRCYLEIEQVRLQDRLRVRYEVEPETLTAQVPNLLLQPIIENALIHGVGQSLGPVQVVISAGREDGKLILRIKDNGAGLKGNCDGYKEGFGIANTRARLESAYGPDHRFDLRREPGGWTTAAFELPFVVTEESLARAT